MTSDASGASWGRRLLLPGDPSAAGRARRLVREVVEGAGRGEWLDAAELAVSELVTNAALHARTDIEVSVAVHREHARVEVRDFNLVPPVQRHYGEQATTGRGMALVASVSSDCGITALPDGKVVWFELRAQDEEPSAEDLLAAWDEDQWAPPGAQPAPAATSGATRAADATSPTPLLPAPLQPVPLPSAPLQRVRLLGVPPTLWWATRQHHDALLRELVLYLATHEEVTADLAAVELARQSFSNPIIAAVEDVRRRTPTPPIPLAGLPAALEPIDLDLDLPPQVGPAAAALQDALDTAERLAAQGELLALPGQAEVVAVRDWVCDQVQSQLQGVSPRPWQGARHAQFETPADAPGTAAAPVPTEALAAVLEEAVRTGRGVVAIDASSRIVAVQEALAAALGWSVADLVGRRVVVIIPPALREAHIAGFSRHLSTGQSHVLGQALVLPVLHADGREISCSFLIERGPASAGRWLYLAWIDPLDGTGTTETS